METLAPAAWYGAQLKFLHGDLFSAAVDLLGILGAWSLVTFLGSLLVIPWIILRLPPDYFILQQAETKPALLKNSVPGLFFFVLKNLFGLVLLVAGIVMLVLPGQGILTIIIGISFLDFPGKKLLQARLVSNHRVQQSLNWIRKKGNKPIFNFNFEKAKMDS